MNKFLSLSVSRLRVIVRTYRHTNIHSGPITLRGPLLVDDKRTPIDRLTYRYYSRVHAVTSRSATQANARRRVAPNVILRAVNVC